MVVGGADAIYNMFKERLRFAQTKLSAGPAPSSAQTAAFLRNLANTLRPHTTGAHSAANPRQPIRVAA